VEQSLVKISFGSEMNQVNNNMWCKIWRKRLWSDRCCRRLFVLSISV